MEDFMRATYETCLYSGLEIVPFDTAARVMAIIYCWGNNENFVYSPKFNCERVYIQKKYGLEGGKIPDRRFVIRIKGYVYELELYAKKHKEDPSPKWAKELIEKRYGFKLLT